MPILIKVDPDPRLAVLTCSGALQLDDAKDAAVSLWGTTSWQGDAAVWDFRSATFDLSPLEVRQIAHYILENQPQRPPAKMSFVVKRDVDFGFARIFDAFRNDPNTQFRVLRSFDEAMLWVKSAESVDI